MRRIFTLLLATVALKGYAQKPSLIGFGVNLVDFSASVPKVGKVDPAISLMYWKGITKKIDFSVRYNGLVSEYPYDAEKTRGYIHELEGSLHARPVNDHHVIAPFISAGLGIGDYRTTWTPYAPLGAGLQLNLLDEAYVFLQANYRLSFNTDKLDNNMFYSIGITQAIGKRQKSAAPLVQLPVVEVKDGDGDGVPDSADICPDVAGLARFSGCPDTDGDGIPDKDDQCPGEQGIAKYNGCPIPDTDGDGINDEADKCPQEKGVAKYQGCPVPDRDKDGINDEEDKCPDLAGIASNNGCPEIKEEVRKKAEYAAQHLYFATGSHQLLKKSFKGLDEVSVLLKNDPELKLSVNGYTDNTGTEAKNQVLSENRAKAVKKYLAGKGIDDNRIVTTGYGILHPVADNKTPAGRAKNRRVEFKLEY